MVIFVKRLTKNNYVYKNITRHSTLQVGFLLKTFESFLFSLLQKKSDCKKVSDVVFLPSLTRLVNFEEVAA
jgi:hypothetical protein